MKYQISFFKYNNNSDLIHLTTDTFEMANSMEKQIQDLYVEVATDDSTIRAEELADQVNDEFNMKIREKIDELFEECIEECIEHVLDEADVRMVPTHDLIDCSRIPDINVIQLAERIESKLEDVFEYTTVYVDGATKVIRVRKDNTPYGRMIITRVVVV